MRYPITNFMDGRGQWWYINAVFNEPPKKRNRTVKDLANGVANGEGSCLHLQQHTESILLLQRHL
jgi:hypothetical protein